MPELTFELLRPQERLTIRTLLGIRFWDPVQDTQVSDNLTVTARPDAGVGRVTTAFRTASGVYAFQGLAGQQDLEYPDEGSVLPTSPPQSRRFVIETSDGLGRFLPVAFTVDLTVPYQGVYPMAGPSLLPGVNPPGFCLFSAPTRSVSPGLAVVRGHLLDRSTGHGAQHAVLEVHEPGGKTWYGISDERGAIAVLFPYPDITTTLWTSPPGASQIPLHQQHWELSLRVRYDPEALEVPSGARLPDLRSILYQPSGVLWPTQMGPPVAEWFLDLTFGQEFVLRTLGLSGLQIDASASPP